jgi:uncharacterized protein YndB with AHSA1/START domain
MTTQPFDVTKHTTAPLKFEGTTQLDAPPAEVFEFISNPVHLPSWLAMLKVAQMDHAHAADPGRCGAGSTRQCTFSGMGTVDEQIVWWDPPHGYAFTFTRKNDLMMPTAEHVLVWRTEPDGRGGTLFKAQVYFHWRGGILRYLSAPMMTRLLNESARNLQKRFGGAGGEMRAVAQPASSAHS